ncbi:helix-turn-helix domain-containing protein [Kibdelosporangium phytohabitans]|uniref:helix-turn-helix domain-containing protein n=1 Tax=Kibdelosporangium phytohabitans TaxID=860235 RepID=UPI003AB1013F
MNTSSSPSPQPFDHHLNGADTITTQSDNAATTAGTDSGQLLFTPAQAATTLQVRESWLRRRAAERRVPCTFLGKHLRFSRADMEAIIADARRPSAASRIRTSTSDPLRR